MLTIFRKHIFTCVSLQIIILFPFAIILRVLRFNFAVFSINISRYFLNTMQFITNKERPSMLFRNQFSKVDFCSFKLEHSFLWGSSFLIILLRSWTVLSDKTGKSLLNFLIITTVLFSYKTYRWQISYFESRKNLMGFRRWPFVSVQLISSNYDILKLAIQQKCVCVCVCVKILY